MMQFNAIIFHAIATFVMIISQFDIIIIIIFNVKRSTSFNMEYLTIICVPLLPHYLSPFHPFTHPRM